MGIASRFRNFCRRVFRRSCSTNSRQNSSWDLYADLLSLLSTSSEDNDIVCSHYENKILLECPLCQRKYPCAKCHDMHVTDHHLDPRQITWIVCNECEFRQKPFVACQQQQCGVIFSKYYCDVCMIFDDRDEGYYHCQDCGKCRTGGEKNNFHCSTCGTCLSLNALPSHNCNSEKECPICLDTIGHDGCTMGCGHALHRKCYTDLVNCEAGKNCPICRRPI